MTIGENIKKIRISKKITQKELADRLETSQQNLAQYENGKRRPKIETLQKIATALDVPLQDLLTVDVDGKKVIDITDGTVEETLKLLDTMFPNRRTDREKELNNLRDAKEFLHFKQNQSTALYFTLAEYTSTELEEIRQFAEFLKSKRPS